MGNGNELGPQMHHDGEGSSDGDEEMIAGIY
jgi:hypothetical protein